MKSYSPGVETPGKARREIGERIGELAGSYAPEWNFDRSDPDAGAVIAELYGQLYERSVHRYHAAVRNARFRLANLAGIGLRPALPAHSLVALRPVENAAEGVYVEEGTRLQATDELGEPIIFETKKGIYAATASVCDAYYSAEQSGKLYPLYLRENGEDSDAVFQPFSLDRRDDGYINESVLYLRDPHLFNLHAGSRLYIGLSGTAGGENRPLNSIFADESLFRWYYHTQEGLRPFEHIECTQEGLCLIARETSAALEEGKELYEILCRAQRPVADDITVRSLTVRSSSEAVMAESVWAGELEQDTDLFLPFGRTLQPYSECYICCSRVLSQHQALISMQFELDFTENVIRSDVGEPLQYKFIMRRPRTVEKKAVQVSAEEVAFEYFNGLGWAKLPLEGFSPDIFALKEKRTVYLQFRCPEDFTAIAVNAAEGLWIRIRLLSAEGCFQPDASHFAPVMQKLRFSHSYEQGNRDLMVYRLSQMKTSDITECILGGKTAVIFEKLPFKGNNLFLCFDKPMNAGPVSLFIDVFAEGINASVLNVEYSSAALLGDFKALDISDETMGLSRSGIVRFLPPRDFGRQNFFGREGYWLKLSRNQKDSSPPPVTVRGFTMNCVPVWNVQTNAPQYFYVDRQLSERSFKLSVGNILSAEVYVDEAGMLSYAEMEELMQDERVKWIAERNRTGRITEFYVRWSEVESFHRSGSADRHYVIDRLNDTLLFGDGINGMALPKQGGAAVRVEARSCRGSLGNVAAGQIDSAYGSLPFIGHIENISRAYGGCDMETVDNAVSRAADQILSGNRMVTRADYENGILSCSQNIDKVRYIRGVDRFGQKREGAVTIVLLMKESGREKDTFLTVQEAVRKFVLEKCSFMLPPELLYIREAVRVELSVDLWLWSSEPDNTAEMSRIIDAKLTSFLDPVCGNYDGKGWQIGELPSEERISMYLKTLKLPCTVEGLSIAAKVHLQSGCREYDLAQGLSMDEAVGVSGVHRINWRRRGGFYAQRRKDRR